MSEAARGAPPRGAATTLVIGAGIAGLGVAYDLVHSGRRVLVLESTDTIGGKLRSAEVAGLRVDVGAEAMVNRRPEGIALAADLGLDVVHPTAATSRIWTGGALRPLPRTLMGAPLDLDQLAASGILGDIALERARAEATLPPSEVHGDVSLGDLIDARYGPDVTDLLLEPLLGGVYAGRARDISAQAAMPQLLAMARRGSILAQGAQGLAADQASAVGPVFAGLSGGMGRLPAALAAAITGSGRGQVVTGATVTALRRTGSGFEATVSDGQGISGARIVSADGVVVATPAAAASRLLGEIAPAAAGDLGGIATASMAVITLAFRAAEAAAALDVGASGFLVPPIEGRRIKASTFSFAKWDWVRDLGRGAGPAGEDLLLLRASIGRIGEEQALQVDDADLVAASLADLHAATGLRAAPVDAHVQRWGGGLPQYALGHTDRVARIRAAVAEVPGLALAGATYDGVGIAPTIGSAHRAVASLLQHLRPA